jgi:2-polyprenyl-3-methyl-5-hydroxy-6-metoxy-1,4-benzoquinol methylase
MPTRPDDLDAIRREVERASTHYYHTSQQTGIDNRTKRFVVDRCVDRISGGAVLELGYIDGLWTDAILAKGCRVDIVEGASSHVEHATNRYAANDNVRVHHTLFQTFRPNREYDVVVAADVVRYLDDPVRFLSGTRQWLVEGGMLIATVPNSRSLHRRIGALMNIQDVPHGFNQRDREVGNLRGYDRYEFRRLLIDAQYEIRELRGCFLKPLASAQMESWSDELLQAFLSAGDELEDYCWFIYAICVR